MRAAIAPVEVFPTAEALMQAAAEAVVLCAVAAIRSSGRFAVALSGGSTPRRLYALLATEPHAAHIDWPRVHVFWSDERCVPPASPESNYRMARESLLDQVPVPEANVHRIRGEDEPVEASAAYERELRRAFSAPEGPPPSAPGRRFDLVLLGLGDDGHTASLFPGTDALRETTHWVAANYVAGLSSWRITLTPLLINSASDVVFIVSGDEKATILRSVIEGSSRPDELPAQRVAPRDGRLRWLVDAAAARNLGESERAVKADLPLAIEDYAMIGDCTTAALVGRNGSIDWLCWPRFDGAACFSALLGTSEHGRWRICPADPSPRIRRAYRDGTMVLETVFETQDGRVALIDFMPIGRGSSSVIRLVEGRRGKVPMRMHLTLRFDYGSTVPWVTQLEDGSGLSAIAGPSRVAMRTPIALDGENLATVAEFVVAEGESIPFVLTHGPSHLAAPEPVDWHSALKQTEAFWRGWSAGCTYTGRWQEPVQRSLLTLKALTYATTGGIVAAPTTSLPEQLGGERNWDYRYCWLRDATLTLLALMSAGYVEEAQAWRAWLQRSVAGSPGQVQIAYGLSGERNLTEWKVPWLPGYQGSAPVRVGNAAADQLQLDVYGELVDAIHCGRRHALAPAASAWAQQRTLIEHLEEIWEQPDDGIWEVRGGRRHFTYSKVMAWVALDRSVRDAERFKLEAPLERWREVRDRIHAVICERGYDAGRGTFTQSFGSRALDASLLLMPVVGFLPPADPRIRGTVAAIERELMVGGFVLRYRTETDVDGLPPGEGAFLPCSFWLADNYALQGRDAEASALFERLLSLRNDVGLLAEEYDPEAQRQVGNFPQAFSHLALVGTALNLHDVGPAQRRDPSGRSRSDKV